MNDQSTTSGNRPGCMARAVSPLGMVVVAAVLAGVYLVGHALGWREYTSFFCGTLPTGPAGELELMLGLVYAASYFAFVLIVPILLLGAGIFALLERIARNRWSPTQLPSAPAGSRPEAPAPSGT